MTSLTHVGNLPLVSGNLSATRPMEEGPHGAPRLKRCLPHQPLHRLPALSQACSLETLPHFPIFSVLSPEGFSLFSVTPPSAQSLTVGLRPGRRGPLLLVGRQIPARKHLQVPQFLHPMSLLRCAPQGRSGPCGLVHPSSPSMPSSEQRVGVGCELTGWG